MFSIPNRDNHNTVSARRASLASEICCWEPGRDRPKDWSIPSDSRAPRQSLAPPTCHAIFFRQTSPMPTTVESSAIVWVSLHRAPDGRSRSERHRGCVDPKVARSRHVEPSTRRWFKATASSSIALRQMRRGPASTPATSAFQPRAVTSNNGTDKAKSPESRSRLDDLFRSSELHTAQCRWNGVVLTGYA